MEDYSIHWNARVASSVTALAEYTCVLKDSSGEYLPSTAANRAATGRKSAGIARSAADSINRTFNFQFCGLISKDKVPTVGAGAQGQTVYVDANGLLARGGTAGVDDIVGIADDLGNVTVLFGGLALLQGPAGTPPFNVGSGTFPATGELARLGSSIGAGAVTSPLITWRWGSAAVDYTLQRITDVDSDNASWQLGPGSALSKDFVTLVSSPLISLLSGRGIRIDGGAAFGAWGEGGTKIKGNWGLTWLDGTSSFEEGIGIGYIGNYSSAPTAPPTTGMFIACAGLRLKTWYQYGDEFTYGGAITSVGDNLVTGLTSADSPGAALSVVKLRSGKAADGTFYNETTTSASGAGAAILRHQLPDECIASYAFVATMVRQTNATKGGTYRGRVTYRRTSAGAPTIVGAAVYDADQETTAGDGVAFALSGNEVQIIPTAADTDARRWICTLHIQEVKAT